MPKNKQHKTFYTIGQASQLLNLKEHVLRFWEKEFDELKPQKSPKGRRKYSKHDINIINTIKILLYDKEFTVSGAKKQIKTIPIKPYQFKEINKNIYKKNNYQKNNIIPKKNPLTKIEKKLIISELKKIITLLNKK